MYSPRDALKPARAARLLAIAALAAVRLTMRIVEGIKPALNIWGVVYIPDRSCGWTGALPRLQ